MIKVNELRYGNVIYDKYGAQSTVYEFDYSVAVLSTSPKGDEFSKLKPIPLTEEWLLRFGFEKSENNVEINYRKYLGENYNFLIEFHKGSNSYNYGYEEMNEFDEMIFNNFGNGIEYVHQLQNLYFALTSEELEIKKHETA